MAAVSQVVNTKKWNEDNKSNFLAPWYNLIMYEGTQLGVFYVSGPEKFTERKAYHLEKGPEFLYMTKGDMTLKVLEQGKHRDILIKEGQVFLIPPRMPHSPQRNPNTLGSVIVRERDPEELDGLLFFVEKNGEKSTEVLYEKWFHCTDLAVQLSEVMRSMQLWAQVNKHVDSTSWSQTLYLASDEEKPKAGRPDAPVQIDAAVKVEEPFDLNDFIKSNAKALNGKKVPLFKNQNSQSKIFVFGPGNYAETTEKANVWLWQQSGSSTVTMAGKDHTLKEQDSFLVPLNTPYSVKVNANSYCISVGVHRGF